VLEGDELLGRWAAVMLGADIYAEIVDRHVELISDLSWVGSLLEHSDPDVEDHRRRQVAKSPAVQIEGEIDDAQLADRIVTTTQLAEQLDRTTLELALRIVPVEWWAARLGTTPPAIHVDSEEDGAGAGPRPRPERRRAGGGARR
jgi:hypothetical protein